MVNGMVECDRVSSEAARSRVIELAANDLGLNRVRLPLRGGYERPDEQFADFMAGKMTFDQWKKDWHAVVNDNDDPFDADTEGFHWGYLDYTVETLVLPWREHLRARGDDLWLGVTHTGGGRAGLHRDNPDEYSEYVLQAFRHLRDRYGLVPLSLDIVNEPNKGGWPVERVAANIVAIKQRLAAEGFHPRLMAPSTTAIDVAVEYTEQMLAIPGVREALTDISYHRYSGGQFALQRIGALSDSLGYGAAMTERIGADADTLYQDLTVAGASAWQQFALVNCAPLGSATKGLYIVFREVGAAADSTVQLTHASRILRHYFRQVRLGARRVRVDARAVGDLKVVGFENPNGGLVIAMHGGDGRELTLLGLPVGPYAVWTTDQDAESTRTDSVRVAGDGLRVAAPRGGALTVYTP